MRVRVMVMVFNATLNNFGIEINSFSFAKHIFDSCDMSNFVQVQTFDKQVTKSIELMLKGIQAVKIDYFVYIKSCQYSMFYTNKMS